MLSRTVAHATTAGVLGLSLTACGLGPPSIRDEAIDDLEQEAEALAGYAADVISSTATPDALERLRRDKPAVLGGGTTAVDQLTWDAVFIEERATGGGLFYESIRVRACVRYTARVGPPPEITWSGVPCPARIADAEQFGPYDETVTLDGP